jgi:hypothetical protein
MPMSPKGAAMKILLLNFVKKHSALASLMLPLVLIGSVVVVAQIEGPKRGIMPLASTGDFEISGIKVETTGKNADEARQKGWEEAQRQAWSALWARNKGSGESGLSDSSLNGIVSAIVVEEEEIGPRRYVATLGVVFDRARAGQLLGVRGVTNRSAPLMLLPVMWDGGTPIVFEQRNMWQNAWAKYNSSESRIDYVRPSGVGGESLLLNAGQLDRRSRNWWRTILDQFGAADVVIPIVRLDRQWPGGPVTGYFSARYGPDNKFLGSFKLTAPDSKGVPNMMKAGVAKMDALYQGALADGRLRSDSSLVFEQELLLQEALNDLRPVEKEPDAELPHNSSAVRIAPVPLEVLDNSIKTPAEKPVVAPPPPAPVVKPLSEDEQKAIEKQRKKDEKERAKAEKKARKEAERRAKEERKAREASGN